jgi:hypothetical protein
MAKFIYVRNYDAYDTTAAIDLIDANGDLVRVHQGSEVDLTQAARDILAGRFVLDPVASFVEPPVVIAPVLEKPIEELAVKPVSSSKK